MLFDGPTRVSGQSEHSEPVLTQKHHTLNHTKLGSCPFFAAAKLAAARVNCRGEIGRNPPARISFNDGRRDRKQALEI